jgi:hypothetical protein
MKKYMKVKTATITGLFILSFGVLLAQPYDFRKSNWGANVAAVKATESTEVSSKESTRIIYEGQLADMSAKVVYTFTKSDKLMRGKYFVTPDYFNVVYYIRDYRMMLEILTKKYGTPASVSPKVLDNRKVNEDEWAAYLSAGELLVEAKWATPKTEIILTLSKVSTFPAIQIDYISIEFSKLDREEKLKLLNTEL